MGACLSFTRTVPHLPPSPCVHTLLSALTLLSPTCAPLSRSSHPRFVDETAGVGGGALAQVTQLLTGGRWDQKLGFLPLRVAFVFTCHSLAVGVQRHTAPPLSLSLSLSLFLSLSLSLYLPPCYLGREGRSSQCVSYCLSSHVCCSHLALVPWGTCTLACCPLPRLRNHFAILFSSQERAFCFFCSLMKQIGSDRKLL